VEELAKINEKTVEDYLFISNTKLNSYQKSLFIQMAVRSNLDPFKREIYAIPFGDNFNIVTGYQTYLQRAERTGLLDGWECDSDEKTATVTIHRKDWANSFKWVVEAKDFSKAGKTSRPNSWDNMGGFMLKKVAICQAFRLAFPVELGGLPYSADEMEAIEPFAQQEPEKPKTVKKLTKPEVIEEVKDDVLITNKDKKTLIEATTVTPEFVEKFDSAVKEENQKLGWVKKDKIMYMSKGQKDKIRGMRAALGLSIEAVLGFVTPEGEPLVAIETLTMAQADRIIQELDIMIIEQGGAKK